MIINELEKMYGHLDQSVRTWVSENLEPLEESEKSKFLRIVQSNFSATNEIPTIEILRDILQKSIGKKPKVYIWSVCLECRFEYAYGLPICPECFKKGLECRAKEFKTSENPPPAKVTRYNKEYIGDGSEMNCYNCKVPDKENSWCKNFGKPDWNCNELSHCSCASCCVKTKKANQQLLLKPDKTSSYAKPLNAHRC